jgi:phosphatidylglycerol---prolipoprotein diacylglyceryl transferase
MFSIAGLTFHWYGLVIGSALALAWYLVELRFKQLAARDRLVDGSTLERTMVIVVGAGLVGARLWHAMTDWQLYQHEPWKVLAVWEGGMSIIGAVAAGVIALLLFCWWKYHDHWQDTAWFLLDLFVFGLPFGQALGRVGNWINQELYGLPTELPWGVYISPEARLAGYEQFSHFHPLFAYEAAAMAVFGSLIWWQQSSVKVGRGKLALVYLSFYSLLRFGLDFLRLDKAMIGTSWLGFNQLIMALVFLVSLTWLGLKKYDETV